MFARYAVCADHIHHKRGGQIVLDILCQQLRLAKIGYCLLGAEGIKAGKFLTRAGAEGIEKHAVGGTKAVLEVILCFGIDGPTAFNKPFFQQSLYLVGHVPFKGFIEFFGFDLIL